MKMRPQFNLRFRDADQFLDVKFLADNAEIPMNEWILRQVEKVPLLLGARLAAKMEAENNGQIEQTEGIEGGKSGEVDGRDVCGPKVRERSGGTVGEDGDRDGTREHDSGLGVGGRGAGRAAEGDAIGKVAAQKNRNTRPPAPIFPLPVARPKNSAEDK